MVLHDGHDSCFLKIFRFLELTFRRFLQLTLVRFCGGVVFRGMYVLVAGCCQSLGDPLPHDASGRISGTVSLEGMSEFASISSSSTFSKIVEMKYMFTCITPNLTDLYRCVTFIYMYTQYTYTVYIHVSSVMCCYIYRMG